jgi:ferrochelatase
MKPGEKVGILLMNTGTTAAPREEETRTYLRQFLSDPRVLDMNALKRWFILNAFILRKRPAESAEAYASVWTEDGQSPLLAISNDLVSGLRQELTGAVIELGMRYGDPSIPDALERLLAQNVGRIIAAPLFPQYSSAANGSVLQLVYQNLSERWNVPAVSALPAFYNDEGFLNAWRDIVAPKLAAFRPDHVLLSYHGLPERHVQKSDPTGRHCLAKDTCCDQIGPENAYCYRAQCYATSRELIARLDLDPSAVSTSFQSRLGRDPWIKPPTDAVIPDLARSGAKRLMVLCPAFTADCLETLEEIGIRADEDFREAGGEALELGPCLNSEPVWIRALAALLREI